MSTKIGDLYHTPGTRSGRVLWLIYELGLDVNIKFVDVFGKRENRQPEFLDINCNGQVPVFNSETTGFLAESLAISLYILDKYDPHGKFGGLPGSHQRAHLYRLGAWSISTLETILVPIFVHKVLPNGDPLIAAEKTKEFNEKVVPFLEKELKGKQFLYSNEFSAADVFVGYLLKGTEKAGALEGYPWLKEYVDRVGARPLFAKLNVKPS